MAIKAFSGLIGIGLVFAAASSSTNFKLNDYNLGAGGTAQSSSSNYKLQATVGENAGSTTSSTNFNIKSSSIEARQAFVPPAPTLSNGGGTYFNRLNFVINTGNNPTDAKFSVAVSTTSNFTVTNYVQADGTLAATPVYQTYSQWGSGTGTDAIGLSASTTYYFKVNAAQGTFTQSAYGPSANSTTTVANTISFSLSPSSLNMGSLLAGSIISSPSNISLTFATNASNGGSIYMSGQYTGLRSATESYTIAVSPPSGDLSSLGEGFGLQNLTPSSPMTAVSPYNGASNVVGAVYTTFKPILNSTTSVSSGTSTAVLKAKSSVSTPTATDYQDVLTFIASASY